MISTKLKMNLIIDFDDEIVLVTKLGSVSYIPRYSWSTFGANEGGAEYKSELLTEEEIRERIDLIIDSPIGNNIGKGERFAVEQFFEDRAPEPSNGESSLRSS